MPFEPLTAALSLGESLIERLFPDPKQKEEAISKLKKLEQNGELQSLAIRYSAITTEASSQDKWTSRARPSFLYVIYVMILSSLPMGLLYAFEPIMAGHIATGMKEWLQAIPHDLYMLFGAGYLGYAGARSFEKRTNK